MRLIVVLVSFKTRFQTFMDQYNKISLMQHENELSLFLISVVYLFFYIFDYLSNHWKNLIPYTEGRWNKYCYHYTKKAMFCSPDTCTDFDIVTEDLEGDTLAPDLFMNGWDDIFRLLIDLIKENGFTLNLGNTPEFLLHAERSIGFHMNTNKTVHTF